MYCVRIRRRRKKEKSNKSIWETLGVRSALNLLRGGARLRASAWAMHQCRCCCRAARWRRTYTDTTIGPLSNANYSTLCEMWTNNKEFDNIFHFGFSKKNCRGIFSRHSKSELVVRHSREVEESMCRICLAILKQTKNRSSQLSSRYLSLFVI